MQVPCFEPKERPFSSKPSYISHRNKPVISEWKHSGTYFKSLFKPLLKNKKKNLTNCVLRNIPSDIKDVQLVHHINFWMKIELYWNFCQFELWWKRDFFILYYHSTTILMITSRFHYCVLTLHIFLVFEEWVIMNDWLWLLVNKNFNRIPNQFLSLYSSFYYSVSVILTLWSSDKLFYITLQFLKKWMSINRSRSSKWILKLIEVNAQLFSHHYF